MPRNKPRVALALYSNPQNRSAYTYALILLPKTQSPYNNNQITKFNLSSPSISDPETGYSSYPPQFEASTLPLLDREENLLVLVTIGKANGKIEELQRFLGNEVEVELDEDSETWAKESVERLVGNGMVTGTVGGKGQWETVKRIADDFVQKMGEKGRWEPGWKGERGVPIMDLNGKEGAYNRFYRS